MTTVHQVIPVLAPHDAVGAHTLRVQAALQAARIESRVFAEVIIGDPSGEALPLTSFAANGNGADLLLYQASTGSSGAEWLLRRAEAYAVNYHNVTPAAFFDPWDSDAAYSMRRARNQLRALAPRSVGALADSPYNATELDEAGYEPVEVTPLLLDVGGEPPHGDERTAAFLQRTRRGAHWLFVGRLAPNKCQHDILAAFAAHRVLHDPDARLTLVGSAASATYEAALFALADQLGLTDALTIVASLRDEELAAYYHDADLFVCLSEHEGFCIPIIEAFRFGTPVLALAAAAVPDTAGDAAVLLPSKDPHLVATAADCLLRDAALRTELVAAGRARVLDFALDRTAPLFVDAVKRAAARASAGG